MLAGRHLRGQLVADLEQLVLSHVVGRGLVELRLVSPARVAGCHVADQLLSLLVHSSPQLV